MQHIWDIVFCCYFFGFKKFFIIYLINLYKQRNGIFCCFFRHNHSYTLIASIEYLIQSKNCIIQ